jgi:hypothetical protein
MIATAGSGPGAADEGWVAGGAAIVWCWMLGFTRHAGPLQVCKGADSAATGVFGVCLV